MVVLGTNVHWWGAFLISRVFVIHGCESFTKTKRTISEWLLIFTCDPSTAKFELFYIYYILLRCPFYFGVVPIYKPTSMVDNSKCLFCAVFRLVNCKSCSSL